MSADLSTTIAPKSDQLNADDLIGGPRTITVTRVRMMDSPDQPIAVNFEGDGGKPYKPGKSMRRVLVRVWGPDGGAYVGRSMTLYRDDDVQFGGVKVGGIRISHMSHIDDSVTMPLTASRAVRKPYTVRPLRAQQQRSTQQQREPVQREPERLEPKKGGGRLFEIARTKRTKAEWDDWLPKLNQAQQEALLNDPDLLPEMRAIWSAPPEPEPDLDEGLDDEPEITAERDPAEQFAGL